MLFQMHLSMLGEAIRKVLKVEGGLYRVVPLSVEVKVFGLLCSFDRKGFRARKIFLFNKGRYYFLKTLQFS